MRNFNQGQFRRVAAAPRCDADPSASVPERQERSDVRWRCLTLIQQARSELGLRDRDIAVLRGLLSLLPPSSWGKDMTIFASNRVLSSRCDGVEERTLRRRLNHLSEAGLVVRKSSPNGKRYRTCDEDGATVLTFGIDLGPLCVRFDEIETLAEQAERAARNRSSLISQIRHRIWEIAEQELDIGADVLETARLALRRKLSACQLKAILESVRALKPTHSPSDLSGSRGRIVRHIQNSDKEDFEKVAQSAAVARARTAPNPSIREFDLTLRECISSAKTARSLAPRPPETWRDIVSLAETLSPAIGIDAAALHCARATLGPLEASLAILGLVEAYPRIVRPAAYLAALTRRARHSRIDPVRMFRSLTRPPDRAVTRASACHAL